MIIDCMGTTKNFKAKFDPLNKIASTYEFKR